MVIDREILLLNKLVYNPVDDKHGIISNISLSQFCSPVSSCFVTFDVFYSFNDIGVIFYQDFLNGKFKIVIPDNLLLYKDKIIKDLKDFFGGDFKEDFIMYIKEEDRQHALKIQEQEKRTKTVSQFLIQNVSDKEKFNRMLDAEYIVRNNKIAYLYSILDDYNSLLKEKGKSFKITSFNEEDVLK